MFYKDDGGVPARCEITKCPPAVCKFCGSTLVLTDHFGTTQCDDCGKFWYKDPEKWIPWGNRPLFNSYHDGKSKRRNHEEK